MSDDRLRWDELAIEKTPLRAAWDEDRDDTELHLERILPYLPGMGTILDLGSGPGRLAERVAEALPRCRVIGVDVSPEMLRSTGRATYLLGDGSSLPFSGPYAGGYSMLLFQHLRKATIWSYINSLTYTFQPGAHFTFQYVLGPADHFTASPDEWIAWWTDAGWSLVESLYEANVPWGWMTVRRP